MLSRSMYPSWWRSAPAGTGWRRTDRPRQRRRAAMGEWFCTFCGFLWPPAFRQLAAHSWFSRSLPQINSPSPFPVNLRCCNKIRRRAVPAPSNPLRAKNASGIGWLSHQAMLHCRSEQETLMNSQPEFHSASSRLVVAAALLLLAAGDGCGKKEVQDTASPPQSKPAVVSAGKTSFTEITAQLDPGGSLYAFLSTSQWLEGLSGRINSWREAVLSLPNLGTEEKSNVNKAFDLITRLIKNSGVESITGVGVSGIALEKGFYQTKFVVGRDTSSAPGGIWTVFGRAPRPLHELDWLPTDTVWAGFSDVDPGAIWNAVVNEVNQAGYPEAKAGLEQLNGVVQAATGKKPDELLGSLGGQCGSFLTLSQANKINIPLPDGRTLEVGEPGLVIVLKVQDDALV